MDRDSSENSSSQSHGSDSDDSNLSAASSAFSDDDPALDMLEHESFKSYSDDNSVSDYNQSDESDAMLEENNNDPNNNIGNENLEGQNPSYRRPSPQPGCSRHFDTVENGHVNNSLVAKLSTGQINAIADNILRTVTELLGSINHERIVEAIQRNLKNGNGKLSLQDLLPGELSLEGTRKRRNSEDISGMDLKRSRDDSANPSSPVLAGFLAGNPVNINNFPKAPMRLTPQKIAGINIASILDDEISSNNQIGDALPVIRKRPMVDKPAIASQAPQLPVNNRMNRILDHLAAQGPVKVPGIVVKSVRYPAATVTSQTYQQSPTPAVRNQMSLGISAAEKRVVAAASNLGEIPKKNEEYFAEARRMNQQWMNQRSAMMSPGNFVPLGGGLVPHISRGINDQTVYVVENKTQTLVNVLSPNQPGPSTSSAGGKVCEEIYQKLRAMFPDIDREYIKTFCPSDWAPGTSHDVQFGSIVERILQSEASWIIDVNLNNFQAEVAEDDELTPNVDDTYEYLTGIFPNADPHYLRSAAERFKNGNDVKAFVEDKLASNDYPTREQYLAKIKVTEEQQRYTKNFNVQQFLSLFPDPFKHFEDDNRKCEFSLIVVEFLKNEFSRVRVNTISRIYRLCRYNMSLSAKQLRGSTDFIVNPRRPNEIPTENISLLQEMAFVRHHHEILNHMKAVKEQEEAEFNSLKAAGSLWTCQCCFDDECMPSKCSTCDNAHIFCNSCVVNGTDSKLGDGETHVPCFLNCGSEFSISTLQQVLPPTKFSILLKKRQAAEVMAAGLEGLVSCPFCHFASIPPEGDKVFKCFNPECMKESCIQCKEPNHVPYKCGELDKKDKARKYIEEKMTQALTRTCYQCKRAFFKEEGCNKMLCPCGAMMCYICNQPVKDYHHFRGQGSTNSQKCPLWSDNIRLNAETVRKVEEDARKEILRQDPTLDIGTTGLAPVVPPPTAGPHADIPGTENLANFLAARVLNNDRLNLNQDLNLNHNVNRN